MGKLKVFENEEFGAVRTVVVDDVPYFVGRDVAEILGYSNFAKAIRDHVDDEDKLTERIVLSGQNREVGVINESGLYSLILSSKMPNAKKFKRWVTSEVLPAIRNNGMYMTDNKAYQFTHDPSALSDLLIQAGEQLKAKDIVIQEMTPKALFADSVATSHTSILVGELAKIINQNGYKIGQNRLFTWLRDEGYLIKRKGVDWNMPTQKSMERGLFEVKEGTVNNADGSTRITKTTKVTGKGQIYFINKWRSENDF
jgi:anti-repressor protein